GVFVADFTRSIFAGEPLVDAHACQDSHAWFGICVHPSASSSDVFSLSDVSDNVPPGSYPGLYGWDIPVKNGEPNYHGAVNWPLVADSPGVVNHLAELESGEDNTVSIYAKNTLAFMRACQ